MLKIFTVLSSIVGKYVSINFLYSANTQSFISLFGKYAEFHYPNSVNMKVSFSATGDVKRDTTLQVNAVCR